MAAGSVAAGGVLFHSELSDIKNKKLEAFGVMVQEKPGVKFLCQDKKVKLQMTKVKRLRDRYFEQSMIQEKSKQFNHSLKLQRLPEISSLNEDEEKSCENQVNGALYSPEVEKVEKVEEEKGVKEDEDELQSETDDFFTEDLRRETNNAEIINVSGTLFLVDFTVFKPYPETLLGSEEMKQYYMESREEYFLERPKHVFTAVMRFYTNEEELICPPCIPKFLFESELEFYGLLQYYQKVALVPEHDLKSYVAKSRREEILLHIEFPGYSRLATAYAIFDLAMIVISTIVLVLESVPELNSQPVFAKICWIIEIFVNVYFTVQTILLISVYPNRRLYFSSVSNWIDIVSVMPFYLRLVAKKYLNQIGGFRVLRLIRLLRILKLFRHSPGSQTMIQFLITSIPEIVLLLLMWSIGVLMFGPLLYFVERGSESFTSAFSGMWFCVVTIGTVGYGDTVPSTEFGKILAALYTILNLTIMTIPISIIITKFNKSMKKIG